MLPELSAQDGNCTIAAIPNEVRDIFVSSTVQDLARYRQEVKDALQKADAEAFLSEDWTEGYEDIVTLCRERLAKAHGYYGIFAHWYGSVPKAHSESITCLEFRWAKERWLSSP